MTKTKPTPPSLEGCFNFRDLGGHPTEGGGRTRYGLVFRSDSLHHLTAADVVRLEEARTLGRLIDLRSAGETRSEGLHWIDDRSLHYDHQPLFESNPASASRAELSLPLEMKYLGLAQLAGPVLVRILEHIASEERPVIFFCAAGKDRTGLLAALLLSLVGVDDERIAEDYGATRARLEDLMNRLRGRAGYQTMLAVLPPDTQHAEPETMRRFLTLLRQAHGDIPDFLAAHGARPDLGARLRDRLVD